MRLFPALLLAASIASSTVLPTFLRWAFPPEPPPAKDCAFLFEGADNLIADCRITLPPNTNAVIVGPKTGTTRIQNLTITALEE